MAESYPRTRRMVEVSDEEYALLQAIRALKEGRLEFALEDGSQELHIPVQGGKPMRLMQIIRRL